MYSSLSHVVCRTESSDQYVGISPIFVAACLANRLDGLALAVQDSHNMTVKMVKFNVSAGVSCRAEIGAKMFQKYSRALMGWIYGMYLSSLESHSHTLGS